LSIDYTTCIEVQNRTWAEKINVVEEDLNISIYIIYSIDSTNLTLYTFTLQEQSIHTSYIYAELQLSKKINSLSIATYPIGSNNTISLIETYIAPIY